MAPTIPSFRSPRRGHCAAAAITISTSSLGSEQLFSNTLVILSSATGSVDMVPDSFPSTRGGGQRNAPRSPSPAPVRSSTVATAASFFNGSGGHVVATSRRTTAATRRSPSPCSVLSVRAPGGVVPVPASPSSGDDEATSRPKRKLQYRKWAVEDELKVLTALAELRWENFTVPPQVSVLLEKIRADGGLLRAGVDATDLSDKVSKLKKKFIKAAGKVGASGGRLPRNYRNKLLYMTSIEVWPDELPDYVAAAFLRQVARRRGNHARIRL